MNTIEPASPVTAEAPRPAGETREPRSAGLGRRAGRAGPPSRGLVTIAAATVLLFAVSQLVEPNSLSRSSVGGMLPFAAVLAILALGQTLVVQQAGIDLSVPGMVSLTVIIVTHHPAGDNAKLPMAIVFALLAGALAGLLNGLLVSRLRMTAIVVTLGSNALLYAAVLAISHGSPTSTTSAMHAIAAGQLLGVSHSVYFAVILTAMVGFVMKRTVAGRRFEAVGDNEFAAAAVGLRHRRHQLAAFVFASLLYTVAGILLAGIVTTPSAFQGDSLLLPSVAAVVLGGTSLLGGRGSAAASAVAALFLSQLDQFVLTTGASAAATNIVQALALAAAIAIYTVNWKSIRNRLRRSDHRHAGAPPTSSG